MIQRYGWLALVLLLSAVPAFAQTDAAVNTVKQYFAQNARYSAGDLDNLATTDAYTSRRSGATYVYLRQTHNGLEVVNATAQAAVGQDGTVIAPVSRLVSGLADRVNSETPSLSDYSAATFVMRHLLATESDWHFQTLANSDGSVQRLTVDYFVPELSDARLVYYALETGAVRLAWEVQVRTQDNVHYWIAHVDAENGSVLSTADLVNHDHWGGAPFSPTETSVIALPAVPVAIPTASASGTYNVFRYDIESPIHGSRSLIANPHNATASPEGWHSTGATSYTITRGNNVHAYLDRDNNGAPDPNGSPDGGGGLVFDHPYDIDATMEENAMAGVAQLFYLNNAIHDILYQYGFDEPSGNFQVNNFNNGGDGNDDVRAEAWDGGGLGNANFFTPPDGSRPRMQMYEWRGGSSLEILNTPIAGSYAAAPANFGPSGELSGEVVLAVDGNGDPSPACGNVPIANPGALAGKIALIERAGPTVPETDPEFCYFVTKVRKAQAAGAIGVIIYNNTRPDEEEASAPMGGPAGQDVSDIVIQSVRVARSTGLAMIANLPGLMATMNTSARGSDFDAGIVYHEYGHGVSNRLTGGPAASGCLGNAEQMGEGWSDYLGMILTQRTGDTRAQRRGVGTFVSFEGTDGNGIRPTPYSTDFAINPTTYQDSRSLAVPHGVGYAWATALWEATWDLIDAHGYDADIYNASGTAGNQVMLQLVMEGMKLQPCSPGFVDGRDAILEADTLLYGGAYSDLLWGAFARRGLGAFASQGLSSTNADNTEDFSLPTDTPPSGAVDPQMFSFSVPRGETEQATMTIQNAGAGNLVWNIGNTPSWLSMNPSSGTVAAGASVNVTITAAPGNLPQNTYNAVVELTTNSPITPSFSLDMELEVLAGVGVEEDLEFPGTHLLGDVYPNPFNPQATFTLAVAQAQDVRIELYDALGRRVALLHEGALAGRSNHTFTVDGSALTSGTYFVRVAGETFAESFRVTLLK